MRVSSKSSTKVLVFLDFKGGKYIFLLEEKRVVFSLGIFKFFISDMCFVEFKKCW